MNLQQSGAYSPKLVVVPSLADLSVLQPAPAQPVTLPIKLDAQATSDIMEGRGVEVIASNPRAVQAAAFGRHAVEFRPPGEHFNDGGATYVLAGSVPELTAGI